MISNCGHDERGKYSGGMAGDQKGDEWAKIGWYSRPWNVVLRHPDKKVREMLAAIAEAAAANNMIGYDQKNRYTFWEQLEKADYDPSKIKKACEADCSSGVAAIVKAAGYRLNKAELKKVSIYLYTGNLRAGLRTAGFDVLADPKYLTSDRCLLPGDVLLYEGHHTAINLDKGAEAVDQVTYMEGWQKTADGRWWWQNADGSYPANAWKLIDHHWYLFDSAGYMVTGWHRWDGRICDPAPGNGDWFFLDNTTGGLLEGACWRSREDGAMDVWYVD